jgi:hypothetical protein
MVSFKKRTTKKVINFVKIGQKHINMVSWFQNYEDDKNSVCRTKFPLYVYTIFLVTVNWEDQKDSKEDERQKTKCGLKISGFKKLRTRRF